MIYYYFKVYYKTFESDRMACVTDVIYGCTSIQQAEDKCIRKQRKLQTLLNLKLSNTRTVKELIIRGI